MLQYHSTKQHIKLKNRLKPFINTLVVACMFLVSPFVQAQTVANKPGIFYAVTGNGLKDTSWLFGTYHLVKSSYLDGLPVVKKAFDKAQGVVVEIIVDSTQLQGAQSQGMMQRQTLSNLLDKAFADSLDAELRTEIGVGLAQVDQMKPMNIMLTLTMVYAMKDTASALQRYKGLPLDLNFVQQGKQQGKQITALETVESQMQLLFGSLSEMEQAKQLQQFLRNKKQAQALGNELATFWLQQDLNSMNAIYERTRSLYANTGTDFYYLMNDDRNNKWMEKLPALLQQQTQFVAVGALHLMGASGLVAQLRKQGYTVTPIK